MAGLLRLLLLVAVCSAQERITLSFTLQPLTSSNLTALMYVIEIPSRGPTVESFAIAGNGVLNGRISLSVLEPQEEYFLFYKIDPERFEYWGFEIYARSGDSKHMLIEIDKFVMNVTTKAYKYEIVKAKTKAGGCRCALMNCYCCLDMTVWESEIRHRVCTVLSYNPTSSALNVNVGLDGHYYSFDNVFPTLTIFQEPSICFQKLRCCCGLLEIQGFECF